MTQIDARKLIDRAQDDERRAQAQEREWAAVRTRECYPGTEIPAIKWAHIEHVGAWRAAELRIPGNGGFRSEAARQEFNVLFLEMMEPPAADEQPVSQAERARRGWETRRRNKAAAQYA